MPQIVLALLCAPALYAAQAPAPAAPGPLAVFAPLVGADWVAELPGHFTDTQHFEWTYDRQFVRNVHRVRTADGDVVYQGETIYAWDARAGRIVWWYWNTTGGYVSGTVTVNADGSILAEGENHGPASQLDRTRTVLHVAADAWTVASSQQKNGTWTDQPTRVYRRVR